MDAISHIIDLSKPSLYLCLFTVVLNPAGWNIIARNEYRNKTLTRLFGGDPYKGCYLLAAMIFTAGITRDVVFHKVIEEQPKLAMLPEEHAFMISAVILGVGQLLVLSSFWALGVTGTFLGDYFGILMDHRVEGFPFNVLNDPMYVGTTLSFVAGALWYESPAGLIISAFIYFCYIVALKFESPFTDKIYANRAAKKD